MILHSSSALHITGFWGGHRTHDDGVGRQWRLEHGQCDGYMIVGGRCRWGCGLQTLPFDSGALTENSTGRIVASETGLAHTRTSSRQSKFAIS